MSSSKNIHLERDFLRPRTPYPSPLTHCIRVKVYLFTQGRGGGTRLEGQQFTKLARKYQHD
jgi:hypothetical protein